MSLLLGRYLGPARIVPLAAAPRVAGSIVASYRRRDDAPAFPSRLGIAVSDAHGAVLAYGDHTRLFDAVRPAYLSLFGARDPLLHDALPSMIAHATQGGARVSVVSDGTLLDDGRARRLLEAGLARLEVPLDDAGREKVLHNVERLLAQRDALRFPGPVVELRFGLVRANVGQLCGLLELCAARLPGVQPSLQVTVAERAPADGSFARHDPVALAELARARVLADRLGFRRTRGSIDAAVLLLTSDPRTAPCFVPWYACSVSTEGEVHPCRFHAEGGVGVGNALREPFADIWNGPRMRAFRAGLRARRCDDGVCATCGHEDAPLERVFGAVARLPGLARLRA